MHPASWLFVVVALLLIGVLIYYLTLTARPEISQISPSPNSEQAPGVVNLEAMITSQRDIEEAVFIVDGDTVAADIQRNDDNSWHVSFADVFERGDRDIVLKVTDSSGRTAEHQWSFASGGDLVPPRIALTSPPQDVVVEPGINGVTLQVTTFADIDSVDVLFDGEPADVEVTEAEKSTEYSSDDATTIFEWHVLAATDLSIGGPARVEAVVADIHGAESSAEWRVNVAFDLDDADARFFEDTGEYATEPFLSYWDANDGEQLIGSPVGHIVQVDGDTEHQYFEFARLEIDDGGDVQRGLIGREMFGAPETPPDRPPGDNARLFDPTGHYIHGTIREFWEEQGGLSVFGYPLSQEFEVEGGYAQYFERALIEVIGENRNEEVRLAALGKQLWDTRQLELSVEDEEDNDE